MPVLQMGKLRLRERKYLSKSSNKQAAGTGAVSQSPPRLLQRPTGGCLESKHPPTLKPQRPLLQGRPRPAAPEMKSGPHQALTPWAPPSPRAGPTPGSAPGPSPWLCSCSSLGHKCHLLFFPRWPHVSTLGTCPRPGRQKVCPAHAPLPSAPTNHTRTTQTRRILVVSGESPADKKECHIHDVLILINNIKEQGHLVPTFPPPRDPAAQGG